MSDVRTPHWLHIAWQPGLLRVFYLIVLLCGRETGGDNSAVDMGALQNVSQVIEDLLDGYDIRLRPQFGGRYLFCSSG